MSTNPFASKRIAKHKMLALTGQNGSIWLSLKQMEGWFDALSDDDKLLAISMVEKLGQDASDMLGEIMRMAQDKEISLGRRA